MRDRIEQFSLLATAVISIIISLLDLLGLLEGMLAERISTLSLLVLGIVVGYLALERRSKLDKIEQLVVEGFDNTILSLRGARIRPLEDSQDVYEYVSQRMEKAKECVDDLTWGMAPSTRMTESQERAFKKYCDSRIATASRRHIRYREVMSFPVEGQLGESRLGRAEEMLEKDLFGYQLRYYNLPHADAPPLLQFMLIDSEEVILAFYRGMNLPTEGEVHLAIEHPEVVSLFQDYYDSIWQGAKIIKKAGQPMDNEVLQQVRKLLSGEN